MSRFIVNVIMCNVKPPPGQRGNLYSFIFTSGDKKESFILSLLFTLRLYIERDLFIPFKFHSPLSLTGECFPRLSFHPRQALVSL